MAFIASRERNFGKYLEKRFGIRLPQGVELFYAKGVRVGNAGLMKSAIHGELGYAACDAGFNPTNSMIQNFGHLATKNVVDLDEPMAREFALGRGLGKMELGPKSGFVIVRHKGFVVGLGYYEAERKKIRNDIPEKRRRKIIDSLP
jgi:NOL1/NOP2/fmu family ribosome biogenesis protein